MKSLKNRVVDACVLSPFWQGVVFFIAIQSLHQDYYGKAAYLEATSDGWTPAAYTIPVAILFLLWCVASHAASKE